jgi:adenylate cyclase
MSGFTAGELADRAGTTTEWVERLAELGILEPGEGERPYGPRDLHRVRFAQTLDDAGIAVEDMARLVAAGLYSFRFVEGVFPGEGWPLLDTTFGELADEEGLPWAVVEQLYANWGLPVPVRDQRIRGDDETMLRERAEIMRVGKLTPESIVAASRFFGDNTRRMAVSEVRSFRENVMAPLLAEGLSHTEMLDRIGPIAVVMQRYGHTLRALLHDRHIEGQIFQEAIEVVEQILQGAGLARRRPERDPAIAFLDLSGYTRLTEEIGDRASAELAARLSSLVRHSALAHGGQAVKLLGDGVMFHFDDPAGAVRSGVELVARVEAEEALPAARVGVHAGPLVFRDGDYFGGTVNLASRITDYARPGEVLVSAAVAELTEGVELEPIGEIGLRGVSGPVPLFRAVIRDSSPAD